MARTAWEKKIFAWNMNSRRHPKSSREDPKMRRIKKLLRSGQVLSQETRWRYNQEEILLQHVSGLQMASTAAIPTSGDCSSGGVAILLPTGWVVTQRVVLKEEQWLFLLAIVVRHST